MSAKAREKPPRRFAAVVARLTAVNALLVVLAALTSPILARALGPSGRGEVAAVFAILSIAPWISEIGMTAFLSREHARRTRPLGVLIGSTLPVTLAGSVVGVVLAIPLGHAIGHGRETVTTFIEIGLFLLPINVFMQTLYGIAVAEQRWGVISSQRVLIAGGPAITIVALSLLGDLTVRAVAALTICWGLIAGLPFLLSLHGSLPWRFESPVAKRGIAFGVRSWLSTLANTGNAQLDQVLMAGLVDSRQLGLYALAATLSTASGSLIGATTTALVPRVAVGESELAARACRMTLLLIIVVAASVALTSPFVIPFVFGSSFRPMVPMLAILLCASVFYVPAQILGSALIAGGNPSAAARGQVAGLLVTVPGLLIALPIAGGVGAAWVSLASYGVTFGIILFAAVRTFGLPYRSLLVVTRLDALWLGSRIRRKRMDAATP